MPLDYDARRSALLTPELQDSVFQSGQRYSPLQLAVEAAHLAYFRADTSESEHVRLAEALARVGFENPEVLADVNTGAEAYVSRRASDGVALLAFRGTQPDNLADLATDLNVSMVPWSESAGNVHRGFATAVRALMPRVSDWIGKTADLGKLIVTGHSLGAAQATLVASVWHPGWLVTLGSPRVGDAEFVRTVAATNVVRLVNCCDAITEVPPPLGGYSHLPGRLYLTRDAQQLANPEDAIVAEDRGRARIAYLGEYAWRGGTVLVRDLADHAPINYLRCFFP